MVEDLQNICLDWDPVGNSGEPNLEDIWKPRGRLVAHVHQHSAAINQVALNANNSMMVTASDDASIRIWNTEQFSLGCSKQKLKKKTFFIISSFLAKDFGIFLKILKFR